MFNKTDHTQNMSMNLYNGKGIPVTPDDTGNSSWSHFSKLRIVEQVKPESDPINSGDKFAAPALSFEQRKKSQSIAAIAHQNSAPPEKIQDQLSLMPEEAEIKRGILSIFDKLTNEEKKEIKCGMGGNASVYCLPEYPKFIIKAKAPEKYLPLTSDLRKFIENNQYQYLHLPDMTTLDDRHLLEEKLPVPPSTHELVMGYITHSEDFAPAVEEITDMFCKGAVIGDLSHGAKSYCYPKLMRYDNLPPLIYSNEDGDKEYKIALIDVDRLTIDPSPKLTPDRLSHIMDLVKMYPLHTSKIIAVVEKHFTLDEDQKNLISKVAETEEKRINAYFVRYNEFLKKRNENIHSELKEINLTPEHDAEVKKKGDIYYKAMSLILDVVNNQINYRNNEVRQGKHFRNMAEYRSCWLNNPLYCLHKEIEAEIDKVNIVQEVSIDIIEYIEMCEKLKRILVVDTVAYLHDRGYIYVKHPITYATQEAFDEFMM